MRILLFIIVLGTTAHAEREGILQLRAAVECMRMPPSLNPYGENCSKEVAHRWAECSAQNPDHIAKFLDCVGFKRPEQPSGLAAFQLAMMRKHAIATCAERTLNNMGPRCETEVAERFERCGPPSLSHEIDARGELNCAGFDLPRPAPPPKLLASCERPSIVARFSISDPAGHTVVTARDVARLRLEERRDERVIIVELSAEATRRLAEMTAAHVGEKIVIDVAGDKVKPLVESAVTRGPLTLSAGKHRPADFCR